ncbi:nuclease [Staphylococcus hominis]
MKLPPNSLEEITSTDELINILNPLIGQKFELTGKTRTDGSNMRKLIQNTILESKNKNDSINENLKNCIIPNKGVPKLLNELIDTYIVTSGNNYNLQVWNRNPSVKSVLIDYNNNNKQNIYITDIRYILIKVSPEKQVIESITILSGDYISQKFGSFGVPTIKHQFILSPYNRDNLIQNKELIDTDTDKLKNWINKNPNLENLKITDNFEKNNIFSIEKIYDLISNKLIGTKLDDLPTKNRGQSLELIVSKLLGYEIKNKAQLNGGYPDIRNQLIEVKVQDSQTIDLGKYSPQFEEIIKEDITTSDVRYLIALTDENNGTIKGILLTTGEKLGNYGTYVSEKSFKCQRNIPMSFFELNKGKVTYNP